MDNKKYEAIIHIAENGSITKTAEEMGYTQSGVTQMINSLEEELGLKLLVRTNKGATLTNAGNTLLHYMHNQGYSQWHHNVGKRHGRLNEQRIFVHHRKSSQFENRSQRQRI